MFGGIWAFNISLIKKSYLSYAFNYKTLKYFDRKMRWGWDNARGWTHPTI